MLVVLDGWGCRKETADNAVRQARTPTFDRLWSAGPHGFLHTSGHDVGLPDGQMGNSEVGHLNIGAGRVVMQDLPRIRNAIASGEIARAPALIDLIGKLKASGGTCHLLGLVSPGGVHSHQDHAVALAKILAASSVPTRVHAITDGRDTPPQAAAGYLKNFIAALPPAVAVATVSGRYYARTATSAGSVWRGPMPPWWRRRGRAFPMHRRPWPMPMRTSSMTSSSCRA